MTGVNVQAAKLKTLPLTYRQELIEKIVRCLRAGDSCSLVGVSGMAKSNLFRHLMTWDVRQNYLGEDAQNYLFLGIDSHALSELNERSTYELMTERLLGECEMYLTEPDLVELVAGIGQYINQSADAAFCRRAFGQAVRAVLDSDPDLHLVFLFDQFDEVYQKFDPHFFVNLRALRDEHKYRISYLTLTREELPRICSGKEHEEFYELFSPNVLGLGPYDRDDALDLLARVAGRYGESLSDQVSDQVIRLTGGHPGLLKAACLTLIQGKRSLPESDELAIASLLQVGDILTECTKLWDGIDEDERIALLDLASNQGVGSRNAEVVSRLLLKNLAKDQDGTIVLFSNLFAEYIALQKHDSTYPSKIQAGPIRIDTAGEVWIEDQQIVPPLTKKELLFLEYLCLEPGRLRTRDEIVAIVYPEEYQAGNSPTDDALNALVKRLRERMEKTAQRGHYITTLRGKGYRLDIK